MAKTILHSNKKALMKIHQGFYTLKK